MSLFLCSGSKSTSALRQGMYVDDPNASGFEDLFTTYRRVKVKFEEDDDRGTSGSVKGGVQCRCE